MAEWVTNAQEHCDPEAEIQSDNTVKYVDHSARAMCQRYNECDPANHYFTGDPKGTETRSVSELKEWGLVGIYKRPK